MMRRVALLIICVFFFSIAFAAIKLSSDLRLGVLDIQQVTAKTTFIAQAKAKLNNEYSAESEALKLERRALNDELDKYNASSDKLKPDELTKWQQKINIQQVDLQQRQIELQKKLIAAENLEATEIINYFSNNVTKIAEKDKLDLVFFKDVVPYVKDKDNGKVKDITSSVIDLSNQTAE